MIQIIVFLRPNVRTFKIKFSQCLKLIFVLGFNVVVVGDWLPRSLFGYFYLLFSAIRSIYLALYLLFCKFGLNCFQSDLIIADQITFHLPLLKLSAPILFYCHFPDKFLAPKSKGLLRKNVYRKILDWAEEICLKCGAKEIVVNSLFTQEKFKEAFKTIEKVPSVLYPGVELNETERFDPVFSAVLKSKILLSLNRFERKKDLHLAIESFASYKKKSESAVKLILAGGYDSRVQENREHLKELQTLCDQLKLSHLTLFRDDYENDFYKIDFDGCDRDFQVLFLPSISQETKLILLQTSSGLLYTPSNEHFGIVPIEAMSHGLPVIAMNSGGPKETILNGITGYLCDPTSKSITEAIEKLLEIDDRDEMGEAGRIRVKEMFSLSVFGDQLDSICAKTAIKQ